MSSLAVHDTLVYSHQINIRRIPTVDLKMSELCPPEEVLCMLPASSLPPPPTLKQRIHSHVGIILNPVLSLLNSVHGGVCVSMWEIE